VAYATPEELADALNVRLTAGNTASMQACLDAAAAEIDAEIDWLPTPEPLIEPPPPLLTDDKLALANRINLVRAVEWWKSNAAAFGVIGFDQTGTLTAPRDGFSRHAYALTPLKQQWGIA